MNILKLPLLAIFLINLAIYVNTSQSYSINLLQNQQSIDNQKVSQSMCPINCISCDEISKFCYQCQYGYALQTNGQCAQCSNGCLTCTGTQMCQKCKTGFLKVNQSIYAECVACSSGCQSCYNLIQPFTGIDIHLTSCTACYPSYYLIKEISGNSTQYICSPCLPGCYQCSNSTYCFQCFAGFGFNQISNQCYLCVQKCLNCTPNLGCIYCELGNYVATDPNGLGFCQPCMINCKSCLTNTTCVNCIQGFYVSNINPQNLTCLACPNQCHLCHNQIICLSCKKGFYLNVVQQILYNITTNQTTTQIVSATCLACPQNCITCNQNAFCQTCENGYFVTVSGNCQSCGMACHKCNGQNLCVSCQGSYYLENGQCRPCNQLCSICALVIFNSQPVSFCYSCVSVYYTPSTLGKCVQCAELLPNCLTCQSQNQCLSCNEGFYLHESGCLQNEKGLGGVYIVMLCIAGIIAAIAIIFAIWACWRHQNGYGIVGGNSNNSGIRASYYQIP